MVQEVIQLYILIMRTEVPVQELQASHKVHHMLIHLLGDQTAEPVHKAQAEAAEFLMEVAPHLPAAVEVVEQVTLETPPHKAAVL